MMSVNSVSVLRVLHWLARGGRCFSNNPGGWLALTLIFFISIAAMLIIPHIGLFMLPVLFPVCFAGLIHTAHTIYHQQAPQVENITYGFVNAPLRWRLLKLGGLMLLYLLIIAKFMSPLSDSVYQSLDPFGGQQIVTLEVLKQTFVQSHPLIIWGRLLLILGAVILFGFATTLVTLTGLSPLRAIYYSSQAVIFNILPVTLLTIVGLVFLIVSIFTLGLGFLITLPVLVGASQAGFMDIFEPTTEETSPLIKQVGSVGCD